jgi:hypothetical protein
MYKSSKVRPNNSNCDGLINKIKIKKADLIQTKIEEESLRAV